MTSTKRLLVTRRLPPEVEARAQHNYDVVLNEDDHIMAEDELIAGVQDADAALICITEKFTARVFENSSFGSFRPFRWAPTIST